MTSVDVPAVAALDDEAVLLRTTTGGICGSDIPFYRGRLSPLLDMTGPADRVGFSLHEVVGEVIAAGEHSHLVAGTMVVGWAAGSDGLAEYVTTRSDSVIELEEGFDPITAVALQPLACVLHTLGRLPDLRGKRVAVVGLGPIGLMFTHGAKSRGAAHVVGVDPIDRSTEAARFGIDELVRETSDRWAAGLPEDLRPDVIIEAVGHQVSTLTDAAQAIAHGGTIFYFGVPADTVYPVPLYWLFRRSATLITGAVDDRLRALSSAQRYARHYPSLLTDIVSHVYPIGKAIDAFARADAPNVGRLKVVLDYRDGIEV